MRPLWKDVLLAFWMGFVLPGILLNAFVLKQKQQALPLPEPTQARRDDGSSCFVLVRDLDGICQRMEINQYLTGVLLAEMPADFHAEALKAQSVAARTYTWKAGTTGGKHGDGSICTDFACCQDYLSEEGYLSLGGTGEDLEKVRSAVDATTSMVMFYDGELIEATYFSSTDGTTEAALEVWGTDIPYLQPVSSPEKARQDQLTFSPEEFQRLLGRDLPGQPQEWFGQVTQTEGGGVARMDILGESYAGTELRSLLGLSSTDFRIQPEGEQIRITTRGYGHRVGMSQYGANAMANTGSTWQQILQHYYPGTRLAPMP